MIIQIANSSIMEIVGRDSTDSMESNALLHKNNGEWNFEKRPGMLYVVVRAISVGTNGNGDHFTYDELKRSYKTFEGKGVFVNHQSSDVDKKRGRIVEAQFIEDGNPNNAYVKCILEINPEADPGLASNIRCGIVNSVSMGCQVAYSNCSVCNHKAKTTKDYCFHVRSHKGGAYDGRPVYEENYGVEFIEVSFVTTGADSNAKVLQIISRQARMTNENVLRIWAKASLDPSYIARLDESQKHLSNIIVASIKEATKLRTELKEKE